VSSRPAPLRSRATHHLAELRALNEQIEQLNAAKTGLLAAIVDEYTWPQQLTAVEELQLWNIDRLDPLPEVS
jgi:hypothetical protein